ncbi:GNAT family protein [Desulfovibrio sp. 86]|uniref:Uncharacterized protein n=1 Tax=uncultured Desulfovibrio sp. TaxID=167968 RepID=A0A212L8R1_9BACT|nr:GNAT family protein [Desulfovibrio sp. 86]SCM73964.1 conserved hypothetical protein [uncultured Desulfovibrio sp.]VZH34555.1 conserved protein of unknown function [Desulfovibrio sp. 86]
MLFTYAPSVSQAQRDAIFLRMQTEGLLGCAMSALAAPTLADWRRITSPRRGLLLCCHAAESGDSLGHFAFETVPVSTHHSGEKQSGPAAQPGDGPTASPDPGTASMLGCALLAPRRGKVWEFDFTTFRTAARLAVRMAHGCLAWAFAHLDCAAIAGLCPAPNRHAWRLAEACGFRVMGRLPQACWHARKQCHVDGVLVLCTPRDLAKHTAREAVMGFGGGYSSPSIPEVTPAPKPEVQKPVTEAATAARQAQKDKASKAAGINASVYTSPLNRADAAQKTLLGQ